MNKKFHWMGVLTFILTLTTLGNATVNADDTSELVVQLINRVGALEEDNRELRGQIDEARHDIKQLTQRFETLNSDLDYRLNSTDKGDLPPALTTSSLTDTTPESETITSDASSEYEHARSLLEQGDYAASEAAFSRFLKAHPKDKNAGAAQYWLGVTFFVRGQHEKAAGSFAKGYKSYPKSSKASHSLLKLAKSLGALDRKADACTTLDQLVKEYPKEHVEEVAREKKKLECKA